MTPNGLLHQLQLMFAHKQILGNDEYVLKNWHCLVYNLGVFEL